MRIEALVGDKVHGLVREVQGDTVRSQHLLHAVQLQGYDLANLLLVQRSKHDDIVDTVQELRTDRLLQQFQYLDLRLVYHLVMRGGCHLLEVLTNQRRT